MDKLVLLAPVISFFAIMRFGFSKAFIYWFIPLLLLIPTYLSMDGPGIPPLSFSTAGFIPFLLSPQLIRSAVQRFHWLDGFIYLTMVIGFLSEFLNNGMESARQVVFLQVLNFWGPYIAARAVVLEDRLEAQLGRVFLICMALEAIYSVYTFRFGINHYLIIRDMWPFFTPLPGLAVIPRWGFFRASGSLMHPIMAGMVYGFAIPTAFWLFRTKALKHRWIDLFALFACIGGLLMTMSRGPIMGAIVAFGLYIAGENKFRMFIFAASFALMILITPLASFKLAEYFSATRATAKTAEQETAMYRRDLIVNYVKVINEKPWLGYSFMKIPVVEDQTSIDNGYILLGLTWGIGSVLCLLGTLFGTILYMALIGMRDQLAPFERGQMWAICGAVAGCGFSTTTVALMHPVTTILQLWAGWATALIVRHRIKNQTSPVLTEDPTVLDLSKPNPVTKMKIL